MPRRVALLDANVLYPARIRDLLIRLDIAGLYQARWSEQILDECFRNIVENRSDLSPERLAGTRLRMNAALLGAMVDDFEGLVAQLCGDVERATADWYAVHQGAPRMWD